MLGANKQQALNFVYNVIRMRKYQKKFGRSRTKVAYQLYKEYEVLVDHFLEKYFKDFMTENKEK